jgi:hypothetical protein
LIQTRRRAALSRAKADARPSDPTTPTTPATFLAQAPDGEAPPWIDQPGNWFQRVLPGAVLACAGMGFLAGRFGTGIASDLLLLCLAFGTAGFLAWRTGSLLGRVLGRWESIAQSRSTVPPVPASRTDRFGRCAAALDAMARSTDLFQERAAADLDAERLAAADLQRQYALMQLLRDLATLPLDHDGAQPAMEQALHLVAGYLDWPVGRLVRHVQGEPPHSLWAGNDDAALRAFAAACAGAPDDGPGEGLAGRALQSRLPHWVSDLSRLEGWARAPAARAGALRTGVAVPVESASGVCWIFEFFSRHRIEPTVETLELVDAIRAQLSGVLDQIDGRRAPCAEPVDRPAALVREAV